MKKDELRDYFAAKAMQAFIPVSTNGDIDVDFVALFAYQMADAMLLEKRDSQKRNKEFNHAGCPSYPNCDIDPMGCREEMGDDVEEYGMRD